MEGRVITLELNEHDALQLLTLVRKELKRSDKIWRAYWEAQEGKIQQFIEQASLVQRSVWPEDIFGGEESEMTSVGCLS